MARIPNISAGVLVILAIAALTAAAVAIVRIGGGGETPQEVETPAAPAPTPAPAKPAQPVRGFHDDDLAEEIPSLTENQIEEVEGILSADPSLKALLAGESYAIMDMGPWLSGGEEWEFIGALVDVALDNPVSYDGFLPSVYSYDRPENGSGELYAGGGQTKWRAQGIESLIILVDLNKGEVASIEIWEAASVDIDYRYDIPGVIRYLLTR